MKQVLNDLQFISTGTFLGHIAIFLPWTPAAASWLVSTSPLSPPFAPFLPNIQRDLCLKIHFTLSLKDKLHFMTCQACVLWPLTTSPIPVFQISPLLSSSHSELVLPCTYLALLAFALAVKFAWNPFYFLCEWQRLLTLQALTLPPPPQRDFSWPRSKVSASLPRVLCYSIIFMS